VVNWFTARTIVEEVAVELAVDRFSKKFPRFSDAFEALKWLLARKVETLQAAMRTENNVTYYLYRQAPDALAETPAVSVVYTYDQNQVVLLDLRAEKGEPTIEDD
jgi:hypothetical protein